GLLPLGGYVLMAEHREEATHGDPLPGIAIWKRAVIAVAGPLFSFGFPVLCYFAIALGASEVPAAVIGQVAEDSPAAGAGLQAGDVITAIDGTSVDYFHEVQSIVAATDGEPLTLTIEREGVSQEVVVDPVDPSRPGGPPRMGIAIAPSEEAAADGAKVAVVEFPLSERLPYAFTHSLTEPFVVSGRILAALGGFATGATDSSELGGPIMIFDVSRRAGDAGWRVFLEVMAVISLNLALINMLPIPVLDGG